MLRIARVMLLLSLTLGFSQNLIFAQEHAHKAPEAVTQATPQLAADEVVVTGQVICLGCSLKKEKGAKAQCSIYGHTNALLIEKVIDIKGTHVEAAEGKIYQFLHNDQSDKLITDHSFSGKILVIVGKIYPEANILEVNFFKVKEVKE